MEDETATDLYIRANRENILESAWLKKLITGVQLWDWVWMRIAFIPLVRQRNIQLKRSDLVGGEYVIAANHQSQLDPFIILSSLPIHTFSKLIPVRFMAHNGLFRKIAMKMFQITGGSFPAGPHPKYIYGLSGAERLVEKGQTILIFPEGKRVLYAGGKPRRGVSELAKIKNVMIIPMKIVWRKKGIAGRSCDITVGRPVKAAGKTPDQIMDIIYAL